MFQFGLVTYNRGPFSSPENLARFATRAEALGYDFLAVNDHVVIPRNNPPGHGTKSVANTMNYYDPLITMMYLGGLTKRIRIGTSVLILPHRPPLQTAKALATLDVYLGGRLFVGVGTGWWPQEFEAIGVGDHFADRGERTDEHLRIFKTAWREANPHFAGKYHRFENIEFSPKPLQKPGPPIWVGGNRGRALRRLVEQGDVWHPSITSKAELRDPAGLGAARAKVGAMYEQAGRDPATLQIALRATVNLAAPGGERRGPFSGPPEHLVETLRAYKAQGLTHVAIYFTGETEGDTFAQIMERVETIAEHVMPHCR
ncbi:MAG: TIGR03619 family F420-dependent LLM class oxidoreductase [Candidatus Lambdaproteobacteria bacterium]|nr:TIGR03619 family F420-dependent LLM class oxidoreductase [Candidatus Lambdaproteobacteria bacterium]